MTLEQTQASAHPADAVADLTADVAALEFVFSELTRTMDPAALLKVLTYLLRNVRRDLGDAAPSREQAVLIARLQTLMQQTEPEVRKQASALRNEHNRVRKEKARHQAGSRRLREHGPRG